MRAKFLPAQYFDMAKNVRLIGEAILEPETRSMVLQIAEDYERMGRLAGDGIADASVTIASSGLDGSGEETSA